MTICCHFLIGTLLLDTPLFSNKGFHVPRSDSSDVTKMETTDAFFQKISTEHLFKASGDVWRSAILHKMFCQDNCKLLEPQKWYSTTAIHKTLQLQRMSPDYSGLHIPRSKYKLYSKSTSHRNNLRVQQSFSNRISRSPYKSLVPY